MEKWYVIRTATNKEKECADKIEHEIKYSSVNNMVKEVIVPIEKTVQMRNGKQYVTSKNNYPGYILINCDTNALGQLVGIFKPINYVIGFLGGKTPIPLRQSEIDHMIGRMNEIQGLPPEKLITFNNGQQVKVIDGPFNNFIGKVVEYNSEKNKLKIVVSVFGRETPIDLNGMQVTKDI